jgi:hypothetical protein
MVHAPDKSFGSVLAGACGSMSGFSALMSSSSLCEMGTFAVFLPKILESNVAIFQFSFQRCALPVGDSHAHFLSGREITINVNFVICAGSAEIVLLDKNLLSRSDKLRPFRQRNAIDEFQTALVTLFDQ